MALTEDPWLPGPPADNEPQEPAPIEARPNIVTKRPAVPYNDIAEQAALGAALLSEASARRVAQLPTEAFYVLDHQRIVEAIKEDLDNNAFVHGQVTGSLKAELGLLALHLQDHTPVIDNTHFVNQVAAAYRCRQRMAQAQRIVDAAQAGNLAAADDLVAFMAAESPSVGPGGFQRIELDIDHPPIRPEILANWLYAGRLSVLQSEPGVGKSWIAAWLAVVVMQGGGSVMYLDEEGGPDLIHERLYALGAEPAMVNERMHYYAFESRKWSGADLRELDAEITKAKPRLAVLDSLPDFLAAAELSEDAAKDVTSFVARVCGRFREAGVAQLLLDHLKKPDANKPRAQSRYSRGSGAKLAKSDATLLLETHSEFDANTSGTLKLWKTKDRRGQLDLPTLSQPPLHIDVLVDQGKVSFVPLARQLEWEGPTDCMDAIVDLLNDSGQEYNVRGIQKALQAIGKGFRAATVVDAIRNAAEERRIQMRIGARGAHLYSAAPSTLDDMEEF